MRTSEWGVKKFQKRYNRRQLTVNFTTVQLDELSKILRKFYAEVKTEKGGAY